MVIASTGFDCESVVSFDDFTVLDEGFASEERASNAALTVLDQSSSAGER